MEENNNIEQKSEENNINQVNSMTKEESLDSSSVSDSEKLDLLNNNINLLNTEIVVKEEVTNENKADEKKVVPSKPQAVLDELDKLQNASHESEKSDDSNELKEQSNESETKEIISDVGHALGRG